jgi:hypothetical protein
MTSSLDESQYLLNAIEALDARLANAVEPFELHIVGGFAMLLNKIRPSLKGATYTDVDYLGENLPEVIKEAIQEVGIEFGLGKNWINNDVLLYGSTVDDLELLTGPLRFEKMRQLDVIAIYALVPKDLLKMKVLAVDTALMAVDAGGEFTRAKDLPDIKHLVDYLKIESIEGVMLATKSVDIAPSTYEFINVRVFSQ